MPVMAFVTLRVKIICPFCYLGLNAVLSMLRPRLLTKRPLLNLHASTKEMNKEKIKRTQNGEKAAKIPDAYSYRGSSY